MTSLPPIFDESELNHEYWLKEENLADRDLDNLKQIIRDLAGRLEARFNENKQLNVGYDRLVEANKALKDTVNNQAEVVRELKARSLATLQQRVHDWRKKAYPDTRSIELQALGVAEESGELCHAVLKYKQGIRGYDFEKTHDEVGDAIGDIIIYAMGVADMLDISVEEALYKTVEHVINRNITQGSDAGPAKIVAAVDYGMNPPHLTIIDEVEIASMSVTKFAKGDRVRVIEGEHFVGQLGTVHPKPGIDPHHPRGEVMVMIDGKDSPWSFPIEHLKHKDDHSDALPAKDLDEWFNGPREPKGVDYAGHVPQHPEGPSGIGCFPPAGDNG